MGDRGWDAPVDVAVAPDGSIYVSDRVDDPNYRIQKFASEGVFLTKWGTLGTGDRGWDAPVDVAVAPDGSVYVADSRNDGIQAFKRVPAGN